MRPPRPGISSGLRISRPSRTRARKRRARPWRRWKRLLITCRRCRLGISSRKEQKPVEQAPEAQPAQDAEAVQSLALVGISWSSNPDAIIEDKARQRTYFVKRGQEVGEGVKVEAIFKDHVVVTFEDREYELR
jgi:hypothetical protein